MVIVSTKEFKDKQKKYFELARHEKVLVKRGSNYINLIVSNRPDDHFFDQEWLKEYLSIPEEFRCNPFDISPSGDLFYADKRNVEQVKKSIEKSQQKNPEENITVCKTINDSLKHLDSL